MKGNHRVLTKEQITEGKKLRKDEGFTKAQLAELFGVGKTTVWENIFSTARRVRIQHKRIYRKRVCIPCAKCEKCMIQVIKDNYIPDNLEIGGICLSCYMRKLGKGFINLYDD